MEVQGRSAPTSNLRWASSFVLESVIPPSPLYIYIYILIFLKLSCLQFRIYQLICGQQVLGAKESRRLAGLLLISIYIQYTGPTITKVPSLFLCVSGT